ncbi:MAG: RNase adaptor protein RapZ [Epulopiscium sp. Nuni2H_MBin003]|nr:MAG: RNase adaptor protein RapZ [Epulopiscium sp. Nuni2H_MBin003]
MELIIVTGMSGAGKSTAIKCFEDIGYYCIDNLPPGLLNNFIELIKDKTHQYQKVVLGIDIRGGESFSKFFETLDTLHEFNSTILFFECNDTELIKRFKETRRNHPLAKGTRIQEAIEKERQILEKIKQRAGYIVDTTHILPKDTKELIIDIFEENIGFKGLVITIVVFGFKYGMPIDADLVFDVRFIKNPYYDKDLRPYTGHHQSVRDFVLQEQDANNFLDKLKDMIGFLAPLYIKEGKNQLVIGIGCTGGKHRSVVVANELEHYLKINKYVTQVEYRDMEKDTKRGK